MTFFLTKVFRGAVLVVVVGTLRKNFNPWKPSWILYFLKQKQQVMWRTCLWEPTDCRYQVQRRKALLKRRNTCITWRKHGAPFIPFCVGDDAACCTALQTQDDIDFPRLFCGKLERKYQSSFFPNCGEKKTEKSEHLSAFYCLQILQELWKEIF